METVEILNKLKLAAPGSVLEKSRFGRSDRLSVWVESRALPRVAEVLKNDPEIMLDWVENLSGTQFDDTIVLTYFLRSSFPSHGKTLIFRASLALESPAKEVRAPTVSGTWAMAAHFEAEIQELFGVRFVDDQGRPAHSAGIRLPRNWNGFPLRKSYVFPSQFLGISHVRRPQKGPEGNA